MNVHSEALPSYETLFITLLHNNWYLYVFITSSKAILPYYDNKNFDIIITFGFYIIYYVYMK